MMIIIIIQSRQVTRNLDIIFIINIATLLAIVIIVAIVIIIIISSGKKSLVQLDRMYSFNPKYTFLSSKLFTLNIKQTKQCLTSSLFTLT